MNTKKMWFIMIVILIAAGFVALAFTPPKFKVGEEVIIKDCTIYSEPVVIGKEPVDLEGGLTVMASPGLTMRTGYSIGENIGKVVKTEVVDRRFIKPLYKFFVEFSYEEDGENKTRTESYYIYSLRKKNK